MKNYIKGLNFPVKSYNINSHLHTICGVSRASQVVLLIKNPPANAGLIPGSGRSRVGNGNLLQYSCLENPMDRRAWQFMGSQRVTEQTELYHHLGVKEWKKIGYINTTMRKRKAAS